MRWVNSIFSVAMLTRHNMANPDNRLDGTDLDILEDMWNMIPRSECIPLNEQAEPVPEKYRKNKTESKLWYIDDENGYRYYNMRYKTIAQDLPHLFLSERTVNRSVDKFVNGHLLEKKVIRSKVNGGKYAYFQFTSAFLNLIYDAENPLHKINPLEETVPDEEDRDSVMPAETEAPVTEDVLNDVGIPPTDKNDVGIPPTDKNDVGIPPTDKNGGRPTDKNAVAPGGPTAKNGGRPNIGNTNIYSIINNYSEDHPSIPSFQENNTSDKNTETVSHVQSEDSDGRTVFYSGLSNKFGFLPRFSPDPYYDIEKYFDALNLDYAYMRDYVSWLYDYLKDKCRKKEAFPGFFAIAAVKTWNLDKWYTQFQMQMTEKKRDAEAEAERQKEYITCPVCGARHDRNDSSCPHCKISSDMLADEQDLKVARDVWQLKQSAPDKADAYFAEITDASADMMSAEWMRMSEKDRHSTRENKINEIRKKYFAVETA